MDMMRDVKVGLNQRIKKVGQVLRPTTELNGILIWASVRHCISARRPR